MGTAHLDWSLLRFLLDPGLRGPAAPGLLLELSPWPHRVPGGAPGRADEARRQVATAPPLTSSPVARPWLQASLLKGSCGQGGTCRQNTQREGVLSLASSNSL